MSGGPHITRLDDVPAEEMARFHASDRRLPRSAPDPAVAREPGPGPRMSRLGLTPTSDAHRWHVHVHDQVATSTGALHGGCGFGAAVEAMVATIGRPLVWATAQFVAHAAVGTVLDLEVNPVVQGYRVTQARASIAHGDHEVLTAVGTFGTREFPIEHTWVRPPDVPAPSDCPPHERGREVLLDAWQGRTALGRFPEELDGRPGSGRSAAWYRLPEGRRMVGPGDLAVLGDFLLLGLSDAVGQRVTGNSLDNTLRMGIPAATEWVLVDTQVSLLARGFGSVQAHLWSEDGVLLGIAAQTMIVRSVGPDGRPIRTTKRYA
jgi:acyl-CoA thioesterase-2